MDLAIPPEAAPVVAAFRARLPDLLGDRLLGLCLAGSAVAGDFDPGVSDVDLLAATHGLVSDRFQDLEALHEQIAMTNPAWRGRIEIAYVPVETLRNHRNERSTILVTSPGEPFHEREAGPEWTIGWSVVRDSGIALLGSPPSDLIPPISPGDYRRALRQQAQDWRAWVREAETPGDASYAVLTGCRALHAYLRGEQASKRAAAEWAGAEMPEWSDLIARAMLARTGVARNLPGVSFDISAAVAFVDAVARRIGPDEDR